MLVELKQKPEQIRRRIALSTSIFTTLVIFGIWAFSRGYLGYSNTVVVQKTDATDQVSLTTPVGENSSDATSSVAMTNTPLGNTSSAISAVAGELGSQLGQLRDTIASVIVPFFTNIEVYNKTDSK